MSDDSNVFGSLIDTMAQKRRDHDRIRERLNMPTADDNAIFNALLDRIEVLEASIHAPEQP